MTTASGNSGALLSSSRLSAPSRQGTLRVALVGFLVAALFFGISLMVPETLARLVMDLISWLLVGVLALAALLAGAKLLESLLDL
ncbi:MAG: hypothetical protein V4614_11095 [Pseudomonadota bacterium]